VAPTGSTGVAQCQLTLDDTILDVQQVTAPTGPTGATGSGPVSTITLVGSGRSSATSGGKVVVQCSSPVDMWGEIRVEAIQVNAIN
jgi:hypothetical protein